MMTEEKTNIINHHRRLYLSVEQKLFPVILQVHFSIDGNDST